MIKVTKSYLNTKIISSIVIFLTVHFSIPVIAQDIVYSDVLVLIDFLPIPSYNANGETYILAEDLNCYGFDVEWNEEQRALHINRNFDKNYCDLQNVAFVDKDSYQLGDVAFRIFKSDINTYLDSELIASLNIGGNTIISMNDLEKYGLLLWQEHSLDFRGYPSIDQSPNYKKMNFSFIERGRSLSLHMTYSDISKSIQALTEDEIIEKEETKFMDDMHNTISSVTTYKGQVKNELKSGLGYHQTIYYQSGGPVREYIGEFRDGKASGKGINISYSTSLAGMWSGMTARLQIGTFENDLLNGFGVSCDPNVSGRSLEYGLYQNGKLLSESKDIYPNSIYYQAVYHGDKYMIHKK